MNNREPTASDVMHAKDTGSSKINAYGSKQITIYLSGQCMYSTSIFLKRVVVERPVWHERPQSQMTETHLGRSSPDWLLRIPLSSLESLLSCRAPDARFMV